MRSSTLCFCFVSGILAGCGKVSDTPGDDAADAGIDADLGGDATVVTEAALFGGTIGGKVGDIDIVSNLPNNMVLATAKTDASGSATIRVYPGGTVTAIYKHTVDAGTDLITWAGVKPGDTLTFGNRQFSTNGQMNTTLGTQTYTWPALAGVTSFQIFTSCGGTGVASTATSVATTEVSTCHREPMDVLFRALNGNTVVGYGFRSNVTFTNGGTVALGGWVSPAPMGSINITGLPPEITSVSGSFRTILDSNDEISFGGYNGTPTGGAFSANFSWHATGERTVGEVFLSRPGFFGITLLDSFSSNTLAQTVAAPTFPPLLQSGAIASSALKKVTWFLVPDAASVYDGQMVQVQWSHTVGSTSSQSSWYFILPPGQTALDLPTLPTQFNDNVPASQDSMFANLRAFDISTVMGYDMLRATPARNILCLECSVRAGDFQRVVLSAD